MEMLLATSNKSKIKELKCVLEPLGHTVFTPFDLGIDLDVEESGTTFFENALLKAQAFSKVAKMAVLADDSGLIVPALNNQPGVLSARYAGDNHNDLDNINKLLQNLNGIENRQAYFMTVLVLSFTDGSYIEGIGKAMGEITTVQKGQNGFGYDSVFYSTDLKKTFGQATDAEKERVSHRTYALYDLLSKLEKSNQC